MLFQGLTNTPLIDFPSTDLLRRTRQFVDRLWQIKGKVPVSVADYAQELPLDVRLVTVGGAKFHRAESMIAATRLVESIYWVDMLSIAHVSVRPDGSGLTVGISANTPPAPELLERLGTEFSMNGGIHVSLNAERPSSQAGSRNGDVAPWRGGGRLNFALYRCTSGFNVLQGASVTCCLRTIVTPVTAWLKVAEERPLRIIHPASTVCGWIQLRLLPLHQAFSTDHGTRLASRR